MKIVTVLGARPQFIKAAALSRILVNHPHIQEIIVHTGQHYDDNLSNIFFEELEIPSPKYFLNVGSSSHGKQTGQMLDKIESVLITEKPDVLLVYGDTNSTLAGALAASKLHIPIAHVEAGLRSYNREMPEEINRVMTDILSEWCFTPNIESNKNLSLEGVHDSKIHCVGDVMYDVALYFANKSDNQILDKLSLKSGEYFMATIHRAENTDSKERLELIFSFLAEMSCEFPVVIPMHPRTKSSLTNHHLYKQFENKLIIIDPVSYLEMISLIKSARAVITDSGGLQKEAFFYKTPCITLRNETEWVELIHLGWNILVPPLSDDLNTHTILEKINNLTLQDETPYGDGHAAEKIINILSKN